MTRGGVAELEDAADLNSAVLQARILAPALNFAPNAACRSPVKCLTAVRIVCGHCSIS
jgi:hypothetical protein